MIFGEVGHGITVTHTVVACFPTPFRSSRQLDDVIQQGGARRPPIFGVRAGFDMPPKAGLPGLHPFTNCSPEKACHPFTEREQFTLFSVVAPSSLCHPVVNCAMTTRFTNCAPIPSCYPFRTCAQFTLFGVWAICSMEPIDTLPGLHPFHRIGFPEQACHPPRT